MNFSSIIAVTLILAQVCSLSAFAPQQAFHHVSSSPTLFHRQVDGNIPPLSSLPSLLLSEEGIIRSDKVNVPIGFENAFSDDIVLVDSTIQKLGVGFGVLVILAVAAKFFLNKMDEAIEKVLVDFEKTMKRRYASRWVSIEAKLEGLEEPARSQKLFAIMEELQESEPQFMAKVNKATEG